MRYRQAPQIVFEELGYNQTRKEDQADRKEANTINLSVRKTDINYYLYLIDMEFIIHNIQFEIERPFDFDKLEDSEKPVAKYPNHYLGKVIGKMRNQLSLNRTKRGCEEHVPNCVMRNDDGIALIRIHKTEKITLYDLPESTGNELGECVEKNENSFPMSFVIVDYRDGKCQVAIEKSKNWDGRTETIKNSLQNCFNRSELLKSLGIQVNIKEKTIATKFEEFIDQRIIDHEDRIETVTFEFPNLKRQPTSRIPNELTEQVNNFTKVLEAYDAVSGLTTMKMGNEPDRDKLKQLSTVVTMCSDNGFDLSVKFMNFGNYKCNEDIVAKYEMNDAVLIFFKDRLPPEDNSPAFDMKSWLNYVFEETKKTQENAGEKNPRKPKK